MKEFADSSWLLLAGSFLSKEFYKVDNRGITFSDLDLIWLSYEDYPPDELIKRIVTRVSDSFEIKEFDHISVRQVNDDNLESAPGWIANTWMAVIDYHKPESLALGGGSNLSPNYRILNDEDVLSAIDIAWTYSVFSILKYNTISGLGYSISKLFLVLCKIIAQCEKQYSFNYINVARIVGRKFPSLYETCELTVKVKTGNKSDFSKLEVRKLLHDSQILSHFLMGSIINSHDHIRNLILNIRELMKSNNNSKNAAARLANVFRLRSQNLPYFEKGREKRYEEAANQLENGYLL